MPISYKDRVPQKEEFRLIAVELKVPSNKQNYFVEEAHIIGEFFKYGNSTVNNPREEHRDLLKALKASLKSLQKARSLFAPKAMHCDLVLSSEFRATLGEIVNSPGVRRQFLKPISVSERDFRDYWDTSKQDTITEDVTPDALRNAEGTVFAQMPGHAFCDLLKLQCNMLESELLGWKPDRGGPDEKHVRKYFLETLLSLHDKVFGGTATSTPSNSFSYMCHLLFETYGESTVGLDEAIKPLFAKKPGKAP